MTGSSASIDAWWGGRQMAGMLPRLFFTHFRPWTYVAAHEEAIVGFLAGFQSQTDPRQVYCHFIGVDPGWRGRGVGEALYQRLFVRSDRARLSRGSCGDGSDEPRLDRVSHPDGIRVPAGTLRRVSGSTTVRTMMVPARTGSGSGNHCSIRQPR